MHILAEFDPNHLASRCLAGNHIVLPYAHIGIIERNRRSIKLNSKTLISDRDLDA